MRVALPPFGLRVGQGRGVSGGVARDGDGEVSLRRYSVESLTES